MYDVEHKFCNVLNITELSRSFLSGECDWQLIARMGD